MADVNEESVLAVCRTIADRGEHPNDETVAKEIGATPGAVRRIRKVLEAKGLWSHKVVRQPPMTKTEKAALLAVAAAHPDKSFFQIAEIYRESSGREVRSPTVSYVVACWQAEIAKSLLKSNPRTPADVLRLHIRKVTGFSVGKTKAKGWVEQYGKPDDEPKPQGDAPVPVSELDRMSGKSLRSLTAEQLRNIRYDHARVLNRSQLIALRYRSHQLPNISVAAIDSAIAMCLARGD